MILTSVQNRKGMEKLTSGLLAQPQQQSIRGSESPRGLFWQDGEGEGEGDGGREGDGGGGLRER